LQLPGQRGDGDEFVVQLPGMAPGEAGVAHTVFWLTFTNRLVPRIPHPSRRCSITETVFSKGKRLCSSTVPFRSEKHFMQVKQRRHLIWRLWPLHPCHRRLPFARIPASGHEGF
jgi:hypothetical protein